MRTILFLLRKEFRQIFRNKGILPILFIAPIIQLLILSQAASHDVKEVKMVVINNDNSQTSRDIINRFTASGFFKIVQYAHSDKLAQNEMKRGKADMILNIPRNLEKDLLLGSPQKVQLIIDAEDGAFASVVFSYAGSILQQVNKKIITQAATNSGLAGSLPLINIEYSYWFNPELNYKTFMIPGILVLLVTMIGMFLSAMNIVREKEMGTIEQLNVTPIHKSQFIIGKLLPFWLIAMFDLTVGFIVAKLVFNIPFVGSVWLVYAYAAIYLFAMLGLGLLVSTVTNTQQQAMFICWFIMVVCLMLGGLFTPIENMPEWAKWITRFNPVAYFIDAIRKVMLKGSGFAEISINFYVTCAFAFVILSLSVLRYRKVS